MKKKLLTVCLVLSLCIAACLGGVSAFADDGQTGVTQAEVSVTGVSHTDGNGGSELVIKIEFSGAIFDDASALHIARDNVGTVKLPGINGEEKGQRIIDCGLRDSARENILINDLTVKDMIAANFAAGGSDPDGQLDVHVRTANDVSTAEIRIKKDCAAAVDMSKNVTVKVKAGFHSNVAKVSENYVSTYTAGGGLGRLRR